MFRILYNILSVFVWYRYLTKNCDCIGPSYEPYQVESFFIGIVVGFFIKQIKNKLY